MENELIETNSFKIEFTPAKLEIDNAEEMDAMIEGFAAHYSNLVINENDRKELNDARSGMLALYNAIETERKRVEKVYNEPLDKMKARIKKWLAAIDEPLSDVRERISQLDELEKQAREDALDSYLQGIADVEGIDMDAIERGAKWLNKGYWNKDLKPTITLSDEVKRAVKIVVDEKKRREADIKVLTEFCKAKDVEPEGWVAQLAYTDVSQVMDNITTELAEKEAREEAERIARETAEMTRKEVEVEPEIEPVTEVPDPLPGTVETFEPKPKLITNTIQVTGTIEQLSALNEFLKASEIKVVRVG